jgi:hypothetical protein
MQELLHGISVDLGYEDPRCCGFEHMELDQYGKSAMLGDSQRTQHARESGSVDEQLSSTSKTASALGKSSATTIAPKTVLKNSRNARCLAIFGIVTNGSRPTGKWGTA